MRRPLRSPCRGRQRKHARTTKAHHDAALSNALESLRSVLEFLQSHKSDLEHLMVELNRFREVLDCTIAQCELLVNERNALNDQLRQARSGEGPDLGCRDLFSRN